ncbi:hypothetical protein SRABI118_04192 [Massilia sp. Bi118]|uniref:choice-of-anchor C family PEP-CTERM protein n=1 Tax=Massilia sp. Bi118 TaxID=2822346 RepID=UPI001DC47976|nr:choice-of-anchor C family protein [Massilia sp. Bi118]CAH0294928.1 hypothetical protein SRABI118_04192 [Massilia sp. Bi118]
MSIKRLVQSSTLFMGLLAGTAHANLIKNGDFEQVQGGVPAHGFVTANAGSTVLTDWTVGPVSIDLVQGAYGAIDGISVDMLGTPGPGFISQSFNAVAGTTYQLDFDLFRNTVPSGTVEVTFTDSLSNSYSQQFTSTGGTATAFSMTYLATSNGPLTLSFGSVGGDGYSGAVLDNVSVNAVPEPATLAIFGIGMFGFGMCRRRK